MSSHSDNLWKYRPSTPIAVVAAVIFINLTGLHGYQLLRTKTWYFIAFWFGGLCECLGYITRIWSAEQYPNYKDAPYALTQVTVLIAPSLFAASMYMELARIIRVCGGEQYSMIPVKWLTKIFVAGDVFAFVMQGSGAGLLATGNGKNWKTGEHIIIAGLVVQIIFFALFVIVAVTFHSKVIKNRTEKMKQYPRLPWQKHLVNIYVASVLVLVRCVFRLIEYAMGRTGYLLTREWPNYIFDTILMAIVMVAFAVIHPSEVKALLAGSGLAIQKVILTRRIDLASLGEGGGELEEPKNLSVSEVEGLRV